MKWKISAMILLASGLLRAQDRNLFLQVGQLPTDERIRFFQTLVNYQPDESRYQNLLALADIQKTRETQDFANLDRASQIIDAVLAKDPYNYEALRVRSQIYLERHNFKRAAENSARLIERSPQDPYNYGTLGDASIEQGQYEKAADAYQKMVTLRPDLSSYNRAAYYRYLLGDAKGAIEVMKRAVQAGSPSLPESTAWCLAELGKMEFQQGDLDQAEQAYRAALRAFPSHHTSLAGLAHVAAARGKLDQAIDWMKRSVAVVPFLDNVALLADYYELAGKKQQAEDQWKLIDFIDRLAEANKEVYNRNLALIYANHDLRPQKALQLALRELDVRGDLYTWDAVAWAYYKNEKYTEAQQAMEKAMKPGAPDPMLYYHAGMIARMAGNNSEARENLAKALSLNPRFDARQAPLAEKALQELAREIAANGGSQ